MDFKLNRIDETVFATQEENPPTRETIEIPAPTPKKPPKEARTGSKCKILLFGTTIIFSGFLFGFHIAQFSTFMEYFMRGKFEDSFYSVEYDEIQSYLNMCFLLGMTFSNMISVPLFKHLPPVLLKISMMVVLVILTVIQTWMPLIGLYVTRFLIGSVTGIVFLLAPIIINQCLPSKFTNTLGPAFSVFIGLGSIVSTSVSGSISEQYWYLFFNICAVTETIRVIVLLFVVRFESPYYVFNRIYKSEVAKLKEADVYDTQSAYIFIDNAGNQDKNVDIKKAIEERFNNSPKVDKLVLSFYKKEDSELQKKYLFENIFTYQREKQRLGNPIKTAFSKDFRKPFLISCFLNFSTQGCGIALTSLYAKQVFQNLMLDNVDFLVFIESRFDKTF